MRRCDLGESVIGAAPADRASSWVWSDDVGAMAVGSMHLQWLGVDVACWVDGWSGFDGRLTPASLSQLPVPLRTVLLLRLLEQALDRDAGVPSEGTGWGTVVLKSARVFKEPMPMGEAGYGFSLRLAGAGGRTGGRLVVEPVDVSRLAQALLRQGFALPPSMSRIEGHLQVGTVDPRALRGANLEPGDLVWLEAAELSASGVRVRFHPSAGLAEGASEPDEQPLWGWVRGSRLLRDAVPPSGALAAGPGHWQVRSPQGLALRREWCLGLTPEIRLPGTARELEWFIADAQAPVFAGRLIVVDRRVGLRVTRSIA